MVTSSSQWSSTKQTDKEQHYSSFVYSNIQPIKYIILGSLWFIGPMKTHSHLNIQQPRTSAAMNMNNNMYHCRVQKNCIKYEDTA